MGTIKARYDGHSDWYDAFCGQHAPRNAADLAALLGPGDGLCLDLGCGTGFYLDTIRGTGRTVVGLDRSSDQLRVARTRASSPLLQGDGAALPFAPGAFSTVTTIYISTDVDDFGAVLGEAARVLRPGGLFVFYGVHPCFNGPHTQLREDGGVIANPTYRIAGWHTRSPWWNVMRVRDRVGMRHHPLAELLTAFIVSGLAIERVAEPGDRPVPNTLAIVARKPQVSACR